MLKAPEWVLWGNGGDSRRESSKGRSYRLPSFFKRDEPVLAVLKTAEKEEKIEWLVWGPDFASSVHYDRANSVYEALCMCFHDLDQIRDCRGSWKIGFGF